jgi:hypothetical protein
MQESVCNAFPPIVFYLFISFLIHSFAQMPMVVMIRSKTYQTTISISQGSMGTKFLIAGKVVLCNNCFSKVAFQLLALVLVA